MIPMKYCCKDFEIYATVPSTNTPNIRIVYFKSINDLKDNNFGFYCLMGYDEFNLYLPKLNLKFCPFCATLLRTYYKHPDYANEIEGKTF